MAVVQATGAEAAVVENEPRNKAASVVTDILMSFPGRAAFAVAGMTVDTVIEGDPDEPVVSLQVGERWVDVFVRAVGA